MVADGSSTSGLRTKTVTAYRRTGRHHARRYRLAAEQGNAALPVQPRGGWYDTGRGVPQDDAEAARWHTAWPPSRVNAVAQYNLGVAYDDGEGVPQATLKPSGGTVWPPSRVTPSQFGLGLMYDTGRGVPQDDAEAVRWYRLAAEQGTPVPSSASGSCTPTGRTAGPR